MIKRRFFCVVSVCVIFWFFVKMFCIDIFFVHGNSMLPTLCDGSLIFVNKLAYGLQVPFGASLFLRWKRPKVGEIVVFMREGNMIVKRVCATAGEALEYSTEFGYNLKIGLRNFPLSELQFHLMNGNSYVPSGTVFVVGDNFFESIDSRNYGFVLEENVLGKVIHK